MWVPPVISTEMNIEVNCRWNNTEHPEFEINQIQLSDGYTVDLISAGRTFCKVVHIICMQSGQIF
jgi:hypothetical protein